MAIGQLSSGIPKRCTGARDTTFALAREIIGFLSVTDTYIHTYIHTVSHWAAQLSLSLLYSLSVSAPLLVCSIIIIIIIHTYILEIRIRSRVPRTANV